MNVTLRVPTMTRDQFLDWAVRQETPYEFDGYEPVAMTGGNRNHAQLCGNLAYALRKRLDGTSMSVLPEAGVATVGEAVRYPDVLITSTDGPGSARLMPDPVIVFEVVSPTSGRIDHVIKLREYNAVPSIRRYVVVDNTGPALTVHARAAEGLDWTATALTEGEILGLPEVGIEVPVDEIFSGLSFDD